MVSPLTTNMLRFEDAQTFVDGIWLAHGWLYPPHVGLMAKHATKIWASGHRDKINIREKTPTWVVLHELAHTLTAKIHGNGDKHGPDFVGLYIKLLEDVLGISRLMLMFTLDQDGIKYNFNAKPWMLS